MSDNKNFFKKQTDSSRVKAAIISEYFPQVCKIISRRHTPRQFGYIDMFAGPGIYDDGSLSTPLLVAKKCYEDSFLRERVWMLFNDMEYGDKLKTNFEKYYQSGTFPNEPYFANRVFGECPRIDTFLTRNTMEGFYNECPSLLFIDPWGYKHINTSVLAQFLTQWGNEVFIFINTKRLNAAFENGKFQEDLKIVFPLTYSEVKAEKKLQGTVEERHKFIINHLADEFRRVLRGVVFYTAFQFREEDQATPSHYLLHITKGAKGFELVKQVYSKYANVERNLGGMDSVETYTFDPRSIQGASWLDEDFKQQNIQKLKNELRKKYASQMLQTEQLFNEDQRTRMLSRSYYLLALRQLADEGKIEVQYTDGKNHKASVLISPSCYIKFI
jgi:three-Cys-motif partner protein